MKFNPEIPYNDLPSLPPKAEIETGPILKKTIAANRQLAELKGLANIIPNPAILINSLILQEARSSSEIENILTTNDKLYEAFSANLQNVDPHTKEVLRYREAMWEGFESLKKRPILTTNLFIKIYNIIKLHDAGIRNTPGTKIANSQRQTIFTPPEGETLIREKLKNLEEFIHAEDDIDPLIKLAIIHYQFEAIHPFTDGNGRTGRILNVLFLVYKGLLDLPILYLSQHIIHQKSRYYALLKEVTEKYAWENWILFMLKTIEITAQTTKEKIKQIKSLFEDILEYTRKKLPTYMHSKELIEALFEQPYCKTQFIVNKGIAKRQRAAVYLKELEKIGVLKMKKVGKENLYLNVELFKLLSR